MHRRHYYGEVLSPIRWWGGSVYLLFGVNVCWVAGAQTLTARSSSAIACRRAHCANVPV